MQLTDAVKAVFRIGVSPAGLCQLVSLHHVMAATRLMPAVRSQLELYWTHLTFTLSPLAAVPDSDEIWLSGHIL